MRLFFDEDVGRAVARLFADRAPEVEVDYVGPDRPIKPGTDDVDWMRHAARNNYLAISQNEQHLRVPAERQTIQEEKLGIVYITASALDSSAWRSLAVSITTRSVLRPGGVMCSTFKSRISSSRDNSCSCQIG